MNGMTTKLNVYDALFAAIVAVAENDLQITAEKFSDVLLCLDECYTSILSYRSEKLC